MREINKELGIFNFESTISDGEGIRVLKRFLKEITYEIAKNSANQISKTWYPPSFAYKERQVHTIFSPAMDRVSDHFLMESPVNRKWSFAESNRNDAHGWVDYWCEYRDYIYYIELKHGFKSHRSNKLRAHIKEDWKSGYKQLESLEEEINSEKDYSKGIFKILIHVVPVFQFSSTSNINRDINIDEMIIEQKKLMKEISDEVPANWSALWQINEKLCKEYSFINGYEKYPAVYLFANISEIEKC